MMLDNNDLNDDLASSKSLLPLKQNYSTRFAGVPRNLRD